MPWIDVAGGATANQPSDGRGGARTTAVSTFTAATIFAPVGAATAGAWPTGAFVGAAAASTIDGAWGGGGLTPAVGDVVFDNQGGVLGGWGVITKITADAVTVAGPTTYDIIEVDGWHKYGYPGSNVVPTAGDDMGLFRMHGGKCQRWVIDSIEVKTPAAQSVSILDINGTALKTLTCVASTNPFVFPLNTGGPVKQGEVGWEINGPFLVTTGAGLAVTVNYRLLSNQ